MKPIQILLLFCFLQVTHVAHTQGFIDVTEPQGINFVNSGNSVLGVGLSFYDFDKDGWDDLTYSSNNQPLVLYRNLEGQGFERFDLFPSTTDGKQVSWVDYDNDGDADLMWSKRVNGTRLWRNDGNMQFTDVTSSLNMPTGGSRNVYGFSWADYDRDGWLDVYMCLYNNEPNIRNYLLRNNGDGTFTNVATSAGVNVGSFLSFMSVWIDVNQDGWPDLYVIQDSDQDNHLFINNQNGTFTNMAVAAGVTANIQSMTNSWADFDLDGDWDVYITEALNGNILFQNNGNLTFTNIAESAGVLNNSFCWGAQWIDFDHNLLEDLHVTTASLFMNQDFLYINNGDGTFTDSNLPVFSQDFNFTYASAKGDFNQDGFWDMSISRTGAGSYQLLQGIPNTNNWAKVTLTGTHSNRDAIGSKMDYYIGNHHLMRYTKCGDNYLSQNSQHEILSMGEAMFIDSLIITWPRGLVEKWYNIPAGEWLQLIEGQNSVVEIGYVGPSAICGEDSVTLDAGDGAVYTWSNGMQSRMIEVSEPGEYTITKIDANGYTLTGSIVVQVAPLWNVDEIYTDPTCSNTQNGAIQILPNQDAHILWEDGYDEFERNGLAGGDYEYVLTSAAGCTYSSFVQLITPVEPSLEVALNHPLCANSSDGSISLSFEIAEASIEWDNELTAQFEQNNLPAGTYSFLITYQNCEYTGQVEIVAPSQIEVGLILLDVSCNGADDGSAEFAITGGTGSEYEIFVSDDSQMLSAGEYEYAVSDQNGCSVSGNFQINEPEALVVFAEFSDVSETQLGSITLSVSGGVEPYGYVWSNGEQDSNIEGSEGNYTCLVTDANGCEFFFEGSIVTSVFESVFVSWSLFPNPARERVVMQGINVELPRSVAILSSLGQVIYLKPTRIGNQMVLDIAELSPGIYFVELHSQSESQKLRFVKE